MHSVQYGSKLIEYSILEKEGLKSHYIIVEKQTGVVLKGARVPAAMADRLILKKARWILNKLEVVKSGKEEPIVTGSRIPYLGKSYYTEVRVNRSAKKTSVSFNYSRFTITVQRYPLPQNEIRATLQEFYKKKAVEKITPRVVKCSTGTGLVFKSLHLRKMSKRWGSCTANNGIIINIEAVKLPFTLIDYLVAHELCHTKVKDHSKAFWAELSKHVTKCRELDKRMAGLKL